jgi:hypothetical protein
MSSKFLSFMAAAALLVRSARRHMSTIGKPIGLSAAFLAGIAIAANADPLSRANTSAATTIANPPSSANPLGSSQPQRCELAALPRADATPAPNSVTLPEVTVFGFKNDPRPYSRSGVGPRVSSFGPVRTEHYQVLEDFDANIALHPYTSGIGPWPGLGTGGPLDKRPSHYSRRRPLLGNVQ